MGWVGVGWGGSGRTKCGVLWKGRGGRKGDLGWGVGEMREYFFKDKYDREREEGGNKV